MHETAMKNARRFVKEYVTKERPIVLEFGSMDVNGTIRGLFPEGTQYMGVDIAPGANVDVVINNNFVPVRDGFYDYVVSSSCFEHSRFFWETFVEMVRITKPGGFIYINAPSAGPYHPYPIDAWRFNLDAGKCLVEYAIMKGYNCALFESFIEPDGEFHDYVMIVRKGVEV